MCVDVIAPLYNFCWRGSYFAIDADISINNNFSTFNLKPYKEFLSHVAISDLRSTSYYLRYKCKDEDVLSPAVILNLFLFALWLVKHTTVHSRYRFEEESNEHTVAIIHENFQWIQPFARDEISTSHLKIATRFFKILKEIYRSNQFLKNALIMAYYGCTKYHWIEAFILFFSSYEALFTSGGYSGGLTDRLSRRCACFLENDYKKRDLLYERIIKLYNLRSDIVHGRYQINTNKKSQSKKNLKDLNRLSVILRRCWRKVLTNNKILAIFNSNFQMRKNYFSQLTCNFSPKQKP